MKPADSFIPHMPEGNALGALTRLAILGLGIGAMVASVEASPANPRNNCHVEPVATTEQFPKPDDPFNFMPCLSNQTIEGIPMLNDTNPKETWRKVFDPNPDNWVWGQEPSNTTAPSTSNTTSQYQGRGLYFCGYMDVPMDYLNMSDSRIHRLAVVKYQVSGLGKKSARTIVMNPGGPGVSGVKTVLEAPILSELMSDGLLDVLSWDPRGVGLSKPNVACYPPAVAVRWLSAVSKDLKESPSPGHLELVNAMNDAIFQACYEKLGDLPRFVATASVARDLEAIRIALGEPELTGHMTSYGTTLGQIYANMFPNSVGRLVLDGVDFARKHRAMGGYAETSGHSVTAAWNEGFLGECVAAGPDNCALAKPINGSEVTLDSLKARMAKFLDGLAKRPMPAYHESVGPVILTYATMIGHIKGNLGTPTTWPKLAERLAGLESGNSSWVAGNADSIFSNQPPTQPKIPGPVLEHMNMVICGDGSGASPPDNGLLFWESLWRNLTATSFLSGGLEFGLSFPCQNYKKYWPKGAERYQGDFNNTLKHPILLVSETHDPATPIQMARELYDEMGMKNARLVVHHGYGHGATADASDCTNALVRGYLLNGTIPEKRETECHANGKPFRTSASPEEKRSLDLTPGFMDRW